jgi:hypothetical protein
VPGIVRRTPTAGRAIFLAWAAYLGLWLLATWPGLLMTDSADVVEKVQRGVVHEWFSYVQPLITMAAMDVVPSIGAMAVVQIVATAAFFAYASVVMLRHGSGPVAVAIVNVVAAVLAPVVVDTLLHSRDTLFGLGHAYLAVAVADTIVSRRRPSPQWVVGIALLTGVLSIYRGDGIVLIVVVPALLLLLRPGRRAIALGAATFAAAFAVFHVVLPKLLVVQDQSREYAMSLRMNPLGAVLQGDYYSPDKAADEAALGRVLDVALVKRVSNPLDITAYWQGGWRPDAPDANFAIFERTSNRLLLDNLSLVAANRAETFAAAAGISSGGFTGTQIGTLATRDDWLTQRDGLVGDPLLPGLYEPAARYIRASGTFDGVALRGVTLHWDIIPWLALLIVVLLLFRRLPLEALIAAIILSRIPLVVAAAPAAQYKYFYSVLLGALVVSGLLIGRIHSPGWVRSPGKRGRPEPTTS